MPKKSKAIKKHPLRPPVNQLPHELIASIFVLVHSHVRSSQSDTGARNCLAFVCRLWHMVALSTPELWDYVSLPSSVARLSTRLALSKQVPVDVVIDMGWGSVSTKTFERSLNLLKKHWFHLRSLRVNFRDSDYARIALDVFNQAARVHSHCIIEEIYIDLITGKDGPYSGHHQSETEVLYLFVPNSQRLRRLELRGLNAYPIFLSPTDTLAGLCELVFEKATSEFISEVLFSFLRSHTESQELIDSQLRARVFWRRGALCA